MRDSCAERMEPALELPVSKQDAHFGVIEGMERAV